MSDAPPPTTPSDRTWLPWAGGPRQPGSGAVFETIDPSTGAVLATVGDAGPDDVDAAVRVADGVWREWAATPARERGRALRALADDRDVTRTSSPPSMPWTPATR